MTQVLRGNIIQAPRLGELDIREHGYLVLEDGVVQGVYDALPQALASAPITDYGDRLIMQSFVDMHLHAPQYPMLGMGMDLPLLDWLNTYTFRTEARFADPDFARRTYRRLASDLITNGTTRVCMFSSLHTEATWILMEELERAGVTGYVGKVNMDRNALPGILQETTEESVSETLRWLDGCHFEHVRPIITPRFTPSCSDELMAALGEIARDRGLYVQSHLSENRGEIAWVKELHPDCAQYWETYDKFGLWKDHTVMAHCVHSDARECAAIRRAGVVVARVKTQLRRYTRYNPREGTVQEVTEYDFRGLQISKATHKCVLFSEELALTPLEFSILWYLCEHRGNVVSSEELFEHVWGEAFMDSNNTVMSHIARLREKMHEPSRKPKFIKTVWGVGYTIE